MGWEVQNHQSDNVQLSIQNHMGKPLCVTRTPSSCCNIHQFIKYLSDVADIYGGIVRDNTELSTSHIII